MIIGGRIPEAVVGCRVNYQLLAGSQSQSQSHSSSRGGGCPLVNYSALAAAAAAAMGVGFVWRPPNRILFPPPESESESESEQQSSVAEAAVGCASVDWPLLLCVRYESQLGFIIIIKFAHSNGNLSFYRLPPPRVCKRHATRYAGTDVVVETRHLLPAPAIS